METIYFLIFIGICAFAFIWATRKTKAEKGLSRRKSRAKFNEPRQKLATPVDNRLANKEQIWEARREHANESVSSVAPFVPKFEYEAAAQYDGYSRRDRHHVTVEEHIKEEGHVDSVDEFTITPVILKKGKMEKTEKKEKKRASRS